MLREVPAHLARLWLRYDALEDWINMRHAVWGSGNNHEPCCSDPFMLVLRNTIANLLENWQKRLRCPITLTSQRIAYDYYIIERGSNVLLLLNLHSLLGDAGIEEKQIILKPSLIIRQSSGPLQQKKR